MHPIRKDFDTTKLFPVDLDISGLKITYQLWQVKRKTGLLLKISGTYRRGSSGEPDAKFIRWKIKEVFDHPDFHVNGLVIDLSQFDYEWGDDIYMDPPDLKTPYLVFMKESNQEAYSSFIEKDHIRFHLKTALAEVNDKMK